MTFRSLVFLLLAAAPALPQTYDLLLKGGHVLDPKNGINRVMDVAIANKKIAKVAAAIPESEAKKVADVRGLYVTPGLIDIHGHYYAGTGIKGFLVGDSSVYPDHFCPRTGVTTTVDAGTSGWRNFPDFKQRVIDRSKTRVLALLNIVGGGMSRDGEDDPKDMNPEETAKMAKAHPQVVVGFKTAHYQGPEWVAVEGAVKAGELTGLPVMVDYGKAYKERPIRMLFLEKLRPGDIYTHAFSGHREEITADGKLNQGMIDGRKRGIIFDIGHGGGSFAWKVADAAYKTSFPPDTISTDLHTGSMNAGMKEMINVMSKILNLGSPLEDVIRMSTWKPAQVIRRTELGHLTEGAGADVAVIRLDTGKFGFTDSFGARRTGEKRLTCELTLRDGTVVWDLNGRTAPDWQTVK